MNKNSFSPFFSPLPFFFLSSLFFCFLFFLGTFVYSEYFLKTEIVKNLEISEEIFTSASAPVFVPKTYSVDSFLEETPELDTEISGILEKMTFEEKAGMLLMPAWESSDSIESMLNKKEKFFLGGIFVLRKDFTVADIKKLKNSLRKRNLNLPLLLSVDAEPSLLYKNFTSLDAEISNTNRLKTIKNTKKAAQLISQAMREYGFNINFAPVYDMGKNTSILGNRMFSKNSVDTQILATAFSEESKKNKIFSTAKHFPGHGSVKGDSHYTLPEISGALKELENFKYAISHKIPIVMIGHIAIKSDDKNIDTGGFPASLSKKITTNLLQKNLNFKGLIITDAMNMGAVSTIENAEIKALQAGADIVLMPKSLEKTHADIVQKMKEDSVFEAEISQKVEKILKLKFIIQKLNE